jgi:hypothetical protein
MNWSSESNFSRHGDGFLECNFSETQVRARLAPEVKGSRSDNICRAVGQEAAKYDILLKDIEKPFQAWFQVGSGGQGQSRSGRGHVHANFFPSCFHDVPVHIQVDTSDETMVIPETRGTAVSSGSLRDQQRNALQSRPNPTKITSIPSVLRSAASFNQQ